MQLNNNFIGPLPQLLQDKDQEVREFERKDFFFPEKCSRAAFSFLLDTSPLNNTVINEIRGNTLPSAATVKEELERDTLWYVHIMDCYVASKQ